MLERVDVENKSLDDYRALVGNDVVEEITRLAGKLKDAHVLHINVTAFGGGVAEILMTLVPLMNGAMKVQSRLEYNMR
jgi:trehalose synthase